MGAKPRLCSPRCPARSPGSSSSLSLIGASARPRARRRASPGIRPAGPPGRPRPLAGEHARRVLGGADPRRQHAGARLRGDEGRRRGGEPRPRPESRPHARREGRLPGEGGPAPPEPHLRRAAALRRGTAASRLRVRLALSRPAGESTPSASPVSPTSSRSRRCAATAVVRFNVETKIFPDHPELTLAPEPFAEAVVKVVREAGMEARTTIQSFDWRTLEVVQRIAPRIATVALTTQRPGEDRIEVGRPGPSPWLAGLDVDDFGGSIPKLVKASGASVWSPNYLDIEAKQVEEAHGLGLTRRSLDDQRDGGHGAHPRHGRRRNHQRSSGPAARRAPDEGHPGPPPTSGSMRKA